MAGRGKHQQGEVWEWRHRFGVVSAALALLGAGLVSSSPPAGANHSTHPLGRVHCGDVITADTVLVAPVVDPVTGGPCVGDGLIIGASNLTLDLNGHAIVGDGITDAAKYSVDEAERETDKLNGRPPRRLGNVGIRIGNDDTYTGYSNVTITDRSTTCSGGVTTWGTGRVSGFDAGIFINGYTQDDGHEGNPRTHAAASNNRVEKLTIKNNNGSGEGLVADHGEGVSILDSIGNTVVSNRITHNGPYAGAAVYETRAAEPSAPYPGYYDGDTHDNVIGEAAATCGGGNIIERNDQPIGTSAAIPISDKRKLLGIMRGSGVQGGFRPAFEYGFDNEDIGVRLEPGVTRNSVRNNVVKGNGLDGITLLFGPSATNVSLNWQGAPGNPAAGVHNSTSDNVIENNRVEGNGFHTKTHRKGDGIRLFGPGANDTANANTIRYNTVCGNASSGIRVDGGNEADSVYQTAGDQNVIHGNTAGAGTGCSRNGDPAVNTFDVHDTNANACASLPANDWGYDASANSYGSKSPQCLPVRVLLAGPNCTSAFTVYSSLTGQYYGTTAGHCGPTQSTVRIGDDWSGENCAGSPGCIGINRYYDGFECPEGGGAPPAGTLCIDTDAARYYIPASAKTSRIYTGPNSHRTVRGKLSDADLNSVPSLRLCYQGVTTDVPNEDNCGFLVVRDVGYTETDPEGSAPDRYLRHMWCMDTDDPTHHVKRGDSGGPVYNVNLADNSANAVGLVVGATEAFKETTGEFFIASCFTSIDRALEGLNATLVTG